MIPSGELFVTEVFALEPERLNLGTGLLLVPCFIQFNTKWINLFIKLIGEIKLVGTLFWPVYLLDVDKPVNDSGVTNKLSFKGVDDEDEPSQIRHTLGNLLLLLMLVL